MRFDAEEGRPFVTKPENNNTDETMARSTMKPNKGVTKVWAPITRITMILYLSIFILAYIFFSRGQIEQCFGLCQQMTAKSQLSSSGSWSESLSTSQDRPQTNSPILLPSFAKGGVIFFLHVPKTGGVSVRSALQKGQGQYLLSDNRRKFDIFKRQIPSYLKYGTDHGEIVVMELHASSSPTLMEVSERLHQWRKIASKNNVPFFAFTVLREPLSYSASFFNFFYGEDHGDPKYHYYEYPTEKDFLETAVFNPQCGFLAKGDVIYTDRKEQQTIRQVDCEEAYQTLFDHMDWIGTTETLNTETFPVLRSLVGSNTNADHLIGETTKVKNRSPQKIRTENLSPKAVKKIGQMTLWDQELYQKAKETFPFGQVQVADDQTAV